MELKREAWWRVAVDFNMKVFREGGVLLSL
jgi:hypothetical protein